MLKYILAFTILGFSKLAHTVPNSFADLVEELSPSVVSIASTTIIENNSQNQIPQFPEGSPFDEFFKDYFDRDQRRSQRPMTGLGSGFIISDDGIIVTNNHVIEGADEITVILYDETEFSAQLLGRDPKADIAVLKIEPGDKNLTSVNWGDSDSMRVGDWTIAIGNPLGLGGTVTAGILSAISRDIGSGPYVKFLQTDASINRGNSGGPLFNKAKQLVGVNTFTAEGENLNFAIAVDDVIEFLNEKAKPIKKKKNQYIKKKKKGPTWIKKKKKKKKSSDNFDLSNATEADVNDNGRIDSWLIDANNNGIYEIAYGDSNEDANFEVVPKSYSNSKSSSSSSRSKRMKVKKSDSSSDSDSNSDSNSDSDSD